MPDTQLHAALIATYRLQFHRQFTLRQATQLVPYLAELGVSHLYASPLLQARPGSLHGYDVCDPSRINQEIGTEEDLASLVSLLRQFKMGLVLDIVPNHMGVGGRHNPWWWDVLLHGRSSRWAPYFDIDWDSPSPQTRGRVLLPVLGDDYEKVLRQGELRLALQNGQVLLRYFDHEFPIRPDSRPDPAQAPAALVAELNKDAGRLDDLIRQQHYRLACWRVGDAQLNFRRFFSITSLAGIRVEDPEVFRAAHQRVLAWYQQGFLDGLRVDHPDGLWDPEGYLRRLRAAAPEAWITVEKILEPGEELPSAWPVAGTTGYDFMGRVGQLLADPAGGKPLTEFYAQFTGEPVDYHATVLEKKRFILREVLVAELDRLLTLAREVGAEDERAQSGSPGQLREAVLELVASFPVYRTYLRPGEAAPSQSDRHQLETALTDARRARPDLPGGLWAFLEETLLGRSAHSQSAELVRRFQQLTGPAMAKGAEDTAFYCFNRFVALNEVGGNPGRFGWSTAEFHAACQQAGRQWPEAMLASSTHDTKRSEDVRARLSLLSEIPAGWSKAVHRWSARNERHRRQGLPDRNAEYLFYQTVVGAWPLSAERALAYMEKAAREAKQHTNWTAQNAAYEDALRGFVGGALADPEFQADLERFVAPLLKPGYVNSLAQTLLKLTAPGVPDIYQGTELWDSSLVDPDNRRPVDFGRRQRLLAELSGLSAEAVWQRPDSGLPKLWLIQKTLALRQAQPGWFGPEADYRPLAARGAREKHAVAFLRGENVLVFVPRLPLALEEGWAETTLDVPAGGWRNVLTGELVRGGSCLVEHLLGNFPVALLGRVGPSFGS